MAIADIQAQLANLTSQMTQYIDRTTMQGYQANQRPQRGWESVSTWDYQAPNQSRNELFSNTYNSDWSDHSNSMWFEPQPVQHETYWQPYEFYSSPTQPPQPPPQQFQSNSSMPMTCDEILDVLTFLMQGSQQEEYLPPSEEFYHWPYEPSQPPQQSAQFNTGTSLDNDTFNKLLTSLTQEVENQTKELKNLTREFGELKNQKGEFVEFVAQVQEQSELSDSIVEIAEPITLGSDMEVGAEPKTSNPSQDMDDQLLFEEEEEEKATAREELPLPQPLIDLPPLPQPFEALAPSNSGKVDPYSILSNPIPPLVPIPCRFKGEGEEGIYVTFSEIQEKEVAGECLEFIKEDVRETTIPKEVEFYDTGQVTALKTPNLAEFSCPKPFEVVFVLEFISEHTGKPPPRMSIMFYTNMLLMIQASTLEFKPLPDHFKYHRPFNDQIHEVGPRGV